jgi:pheromone shutdown protein TraB
MGPYRNTILIVIVASMIILYLKMCVYCRFLFLQQLLRNSLSDWLIVRGKYEYIAQYCVRGGVTSIQNCFASLFFHKMATDGHKS